MHLAHLRLRDFRNYARLDADFAPGFHLLLGDNAQGKTNILEAVYLMATLRSFRGVGGAQMIRHGQRGYFVGGTVVGGTIPASSSPAMRDVSPLHLIRADLRRLLRFSPAKARAKLKCSGRRMNENWPWTANR